MRLVGQGVWALMDDVFSVYCGGDTVPGTDLAVSHVLLTLPDGVAEPNGRGRSRIRLTEEEARSLGERLIRAADYSQEADGE